jgi:FG-GAP repeat protein/type IX secretion system substrate protein
MKRIILITLILIAFISTYAQNFNEINKLVASDRDEGDIFGISVSIDGNYAIVGSVWEEEDTFGNNTLYEAGSAYIFQRKADRNWYEIQKIVPSDRADFDRFGYSVSISGNYAIIGAYGKNVEDGVNILPRAGAAYIFERDVKGTWHEVQKIVPFDQASFKEFGTVVSISGNYAIIGNCKDDMDTTGGNKLKAAGSAYIFERDINGKWNQAQKIIASDREMNDCFGYSVSISGKFAIIGACYEDEDISAKDSLPEAGSAYIFERDISGKWFQVQKIVASDREAKDLFGWSVSISNSNAVVGAFSEMDDVNGWNTMYGSGSAYIFARDNNGKWNQEKKIVAFDREANDRFGNSVSISEDYILIGAKWKDVNNGNWIYNAGSAYIFERDNNGEWKFFQKIVASDRGESDVFGISVAISGDFAIIGSFYEDEDILGENTLAFAGSAYVFEKGNAVGVIVNTFSDNMITYPNPFTHTLQIRFEQPTERDLQLQIIDISGRMLLQKAIPAGRQRQNVNTSALPPGIYLYRIGNDETGWQTGKVVKAVSGF